MDSVYVNCPTYENESYLVRLINKEDTKELLKVYSDKQAYLFFNSDRCDDDFYYPTLERMIQAMDFWFDAYYKWKAFVRMSIINKKTMQVIGTFEFFHLEIDDHFNNSCLTRLDLRSDYEKEEVIVELMNLVMNHLFDDYYCEKIITKYFDDDSIRCKALTSIGFEKIEDAKERPNYCAKLKK